jgi:hypothetical protein
MVAVVVSQLDHVLLIRIRQFGHVFRTVRDASETQRQQRPKTQLSTQTLHKIKTPF